MNTILEFDPSRRTTSAAGPGYLVCTCGSEYFELVEIRDGAEASGVVTLNPDGTVAGYSGTPRCAACGLTKET